MKRLREITSVEDIDEELIRLREDRLQPKWSWTTIPSELVVGFAKDLDYLTLARLCKTCKYFSQCLAKEIQIENTTAFANLGTKEECYMEPVTKCLINYMSMGIDRALQQCRYWVSKSADIFTQWLSLDHFLHPERYHQNNLNPLPIFPQVIPIRVHGRSYNYNNAGFIVIKKIDDDIIDVEIPFDHVNHTSAAKGLWFIRSQLRREFHDYCELVGARKKKRQWYYSNPNAFEPSNRQKTVKIRFSRRHQEYREAFDGQDLACQQCYDDMTMHCNKFVCC